MMEESETVEPAGSLQLWVQRWEDDGGRVVPAGAAVGDREGDDDAWRYREDGATHAGSLPR
jgi:hypothetical protein